MYTPCAMQDFQNLTPKQQAAKRRELQQQKRELELKVATMNNQQDRRAIEERKKRMVHESNVGLPGHRVRCGRQRCQPMQLTA